MNEISDLTSGKELIVRKKLSGFIEKTLRECGYDFRHEVFKGLICSEIGSMTPLEDKIKSYYDATYYLFSNHKSPLTKTMLNKFFYLIDGEIPNVSMVTKLVTIFFNYLDISPLEAAISFHLEAYKQMNKLEENKRFIVSLILMNFMLLKYDIPTIKFVKKDFNKYYKARDKYFLGDEQDMYVFLLDVINNYKFQDKEYYQNLKPLTIQEIYTQIEKDKEDLINRFGIKHLSLFGSFSKGKERIDSDIDLLVFFNFNLTREEKIESIKYLEKYYFNIFHRYIDFLEVGDIISDGLIKEVDNVKKIY